MPQTGVAREMDVPMITAPKVGKTLELFFVDGSPDGLITAHDFNWTGLVVVCPRLQLDVALERPEASQPSVYLLLGEEQRGGVWTYIGESEKPSNRIRTHDLNKDQWTKLVLITSKSGGLDKAKIRYLEARLIEEAHRVGRAHLTNGTNPPQPALGEAARSDMEVFLHNLFDVLPAVRVDVFVERVRPSAAEPAAPTLASAPTAQTQVMPAAQDSTLFVLKYKKAGVEAFALKTPNEFIVQVGSTACLEVKSPESIPNAVIQREELVRSGILAPAGPVLRFTQAYVFSSPSAAGTLINGFSTNGQTAWIKADSGETYKDWEAKRLGLPVTNAR